MNKYKVTLSIPIYNVEKYVEKSLLSALNQTFDSIEFLIIDDKGSDNSMEVVRKVLSEHPRAKDVRIIDHVTNKGTGAVRNTAIKEASGSYLYFMDSDDEITPDCIEKLYVNMEKQKVDFVASSYIRKTLGGEVKEEMKPYMLQTVVCRNNERIIDALYSDNLEIHVMVHNKLYDIKFLRENDIKCIPNHVTEDIFFSFQVFLKAKSCTLIPDKTYVYYVVPNSTTDNSARTEEKSIKIAKELIAILEYKIKILEQNRNKAWFKKAMKCLVVDSYWYANDVLKSKIGEKTGYVNKLMTHEQ